MGHVMDGEVYVMREKCEEREDPKISHHRQDSLTQRMIN